MTIGDKIRIFRKKENWTQIELADHLGVSSNLVSKWEQNERMPQYEDIEKLTRIFKQPIEYFLPPKSTLISLRIFKGFAENKMLFIFDDWKNTHKYEKIPLDIIDNDIFDDNVSNLTQEEIDNLYFLYKEADNIIHIIRLGFNRVVDKRYYAMRNGDEIEICQLFNSKGDSFYSIQVNQKMIENLINTLPEAQSADLEKDDLINMKSFGKEEREYIIGIIVATIRKIYK